APARRWATRMGADRNLDRSVDDSHQQCGHVVEVSRCAAFAPLEDEMPATRIAAGDRFAPVWLREDLGRDEHRTRRRVTGTASEGDAVHGMPALVGGRW